MSTAKWKAFRVLNENDGDLCAKQPGIQWMRAGVAARGEPEQVYRIEYYENNSERDVKLLSNEGPNFAKLKRER